MKFHGVNKNCTELCRIELDRTVLNWSEINRTELNWIQTTLLVISCRSMSLGVCDPAKTQVRHTKDGRKESRKNNNNCCDCCRMAGPAPPIIKEGTLTKQGEIIQTWWLFATLSRSDVHIPRRYLILRSQFRTEMIMFWNTELSKSILCYLQSLRGLIAQEEAVVRAHWFGAPILQRRETQDEEAAGYRPYQHLQNKESH